MWQVRAVASSRSLRRMRCSVLPVVRFLSDGVRTCLGFGCHQKRTRESAGSGCPEQRRLGAHAGIRATLKHVRPFPRPGRSWIGTSLIALSNQRTNDR